MVSAINEIGARLDRSCHYIVTKKGPRLLSHFTSTVDSEKSVGSKLWVFYTHGEIFEAGVDSPSKDRGTKLCPAPFLRKSWQAEKWPSALYSIQYNSRPLDPAKSEIAIKQLLSAAIMMKKALKK